LGGRDQPVGILEEILIIAVIDGMGGGIGVQIVTQLRQELPLEVGW
jgi:hypothetical protein